MNIPVKLTPAAQELMKHINAISPKKKKRSKYNAKKVVIDGIKFDSIKEGTRYSVLKTLARVGHISELKLQVPYKFEYEGQLICKYIADFTYFENGAFIVEDAKGVLTTMYKLKKRMMKIFHNIEVRET